MRWKDGSEDLKTSPTPNFYPKKMILKQGIRHYLLDTGDIVYIYSHNKVVYVVDSRNQKYLADKSLQRLETDLDPSLFFKANRTHIINFNYIRSFVTHEKNKVKVEMKMTNKDETVLVSQPRVGAFKQWVVEGL